MTPSIATECSSCGKFSRMPLNDDLQIVCGYCSTARRIGEMNFLEEACPLCACKGFYRQKDFNQVLGCSIMLAGIVLVPFTYGLSLPVFAALDWLLYRRINMLAVCYRCRSEFRGFDIPEHIETFEHFTGMKYEPKQLHMRDRRKLINYK